MSGKIEIITGCMFSGKTTELLRRVRRAKVAKLRVLLFKPHRDTRARGQVKTHDDLIESAIEISPDTDVIDRSSSELLKEEIRKCSQYDVLAIDEFQFFDDGIVKLCDDLANSGKIVILAGLNTNFRGEPFGDHVSQLLAIADKIDMFDAICVHDGCHEVATRTQRIVNGRPAKWDDPIYLLGGDDYYQAVCRKHHTIDVPTDKKVKRQYKVLKNRMKD